MSSPSSLLSLWMQRPVTMHSHPASEHTESSHHPTPIQLICMSSTCSSMPCPQPALQLLLSACLAANSRQIVSTTTPPFKKIPQAAKQQIQLRDKHNAFLHFNIIERLCLSHSQLALLLPQLTSGKVASYSNNSNFICSLDLHLLSCTRQK